MPLVPHPPGIEQHWKRRIPRHRRRPPPRRHQPRPPIRRRESSVREQPPAPHSTHWCRPLHRRQRFVLRERRPPSHPRRHLRQRPPIRPRLTRRIAERPLPTDPPLRIRHRPVPLAPPARRQHHVRMPRRIRRPQIAHHHERTPLQPRPNPLRPRHAVGRISADDPQRPDPPVMHRLEQIHRLQARRPRHPRRPPEPPHPIHRARLVEPHMRRHLVGEPAHLAPTHRVRLPRHAERPRPRPPDPPRRQMHVQDRVHLVRPRGRLVHPLREHRHHPLRPREQRVERRDLRSLQPRRRHIRLARHIQRRLEPRRMGRTPRPIDRAYPIQMRQQPGEQRHVRPRRQRQMQIRLFRRRRPPRIDHHDPRSPRLPRRHQPLVQHRMAPGQIAADQHHQIGQLQILIRPRHHIRPERPNLSRHRRRHAQPRIRVDTGRADEPLHQLVGHVVILGRTLPRHVERHAVRSMRRDRLGEPRRDQPQCRVPTRPLARHQRMPQPRPIPQRLRQRRPLAAQPPEIRGMRGIAHDPPIRLRHHPTPDPAIGAGGPHPAHPAGCS